MAVARLGGLTILISGFVSLLSILIFLSTPPSNPFVTPAEMGVTATIDSVFALVMILGGVAGLSLRAFKLAMAGACVGLFEGLFFSMSGLSMVILILSVIGIALLLEGSGEFKSRRSAQARYRASRNQRPAQKIQKTPERDGYSDILQEYMRK